MEKIKRMFKGIGKFFKCVPVEVWVHIVTLILICLMVGVMIAMLTHPEFAKMVFGILLMVALAGMLLYFLYQIYSVVFGFICTFLDDWDRR